MIVVIRSIEYNFYSVTAMDYNYQGAFFYEKI